MDEVGYSGILNTQWKWEDSPDLCLIIYFLVLIIKKKKFFLKDACFICLFGCIGPQLQHAGSSLWCLGLVALGHMGSQFLNQGSNLHHLLGRRILNHRTTRKFPPSSFYFCFCLDILDELFIWCKYSSLQKLGACFFCVCGFCFLSSPCSPMIATQRHVHELIG